MGEHTSLDELERLAKAAGNETWWEAGEFEKDGYPTGDAEFIAATDPQTVVALIDRLEKAEARVKELRDKHRQTFTALVAVEGRAEKAEAIIERVRKMHRPVHAVFNWHSGLRYEEPCPDCHGKAGVHECGCWADEDVEFVCRECDRPKSAQGRRGDLWPCETVKALTEGDEQ